MNDYKELIDGLRICVKYRKAADALCNAEFAADAIEQLARERDAAVMDLKAYSDCDNCKHNTEENFENGFCLDCSFAPKRNCKWQWRGVEGKHE